MDAFVYAPPTITWLEAYAVGLPVIKYCGEWLDLDASEALTRGDPVRVSSRDTLRADLAAALVEAPDARNGTRQEVLRRVFSPVDEQAWRNQA